MNQDISDAGNSLIEGVTKAWDRLLQQIDDILGWVPGPVPSVRRPSAMADGELPGKVKELIALAIAVSRECDACIAAHARGAASRGATDEEVAEMLGVAILMNGGPGTVWAPRAYAAFQEFAADLAAGGYPPVPPPAP